jgi:hypothetical protein
MGRPVIWRREGYGNRSELPQAETVAGVHACHACINQETMFSLSESWLPKQHEVRPRRIASAAINTYFVDRFYIHYRRIRLGHVDESANSPSSLDLHFPICSEHGFWAENRSG